MNYVLMCLFAAGMFSGGVFAQDGEGVEEEAGEDVSAQVDEYFNEVDGNEDGKVTKAEFKKGVKDEGFEDEASLDYLQYYGAMLTDFLAADADDNDEVTKDELTTLLKTQLDGDSPRLSAADLKTLDKEYCTPGAKALINAVDGDNDGKVSKKESERMGGDGFGEVDLDSDGYVTPLEMRKAILKDARKGYDAPEYEFESDDKIEVTPKAQKAFDEMDSDGDGSISKPEIRKAYGDPESVAHWWGVYIAFLSMDADDSDGVDIQEFLYYGKDESWGVPHKVYESDKDAAMVEIWSDLDADEDGKVSKKEFGKVFPDTKEYDGYDKDKDGNVDKDEFWDGVWSGFGKDFKFVKNDDRENIKKRDDADEKPEDAKPDEETAPTDDTKDEPVEEPEDKD